MREERRREAPVTTPCSQNESPSGMATSGVPVQDTATKEAVTSGQCSQHCVSPVAKLEAEPRSTTHLVDLSTPLQRVSAFCQAVFSTVIPNELWGIGEAQAHNRQAILKKVDLFLRLRRFETLNLHDLMQGIKVRMLPSMTQQHMLTLASGCRYAVAGTFKSPCWKDEPDRSSKTTTDSRRVSLLPVRLIFSAACPKQLLRDRVQQPQE